MLNTLGNLPKKYTTILVSSFNRLYHNNSFLEEPQPVEILCDPCDWIKTADEELEWLPKEETWTISPEWLCKVGYWLEALPSVSYFFDSL